MLTRNMATEWARHNIQVNGIGPGYFATEQTESIRVDGHPFNDFIVGRTPAGDGATRRIFRVLPYSWHQQPATSSMGRSSMSTAAFSRPLASQERIGLFMISDAQPSGLAVFGETQRRHNRHWLCPLPSLPCLHRRGTTLQGHHSCCTGCMRPL